MWGVVNNLSQEPQHSTPKQKIFKIESRLCSVERIDGISLPHKYAGTSDFGAGSDDRVVGGNYALTGTMLVSRANPKGRGK